MLTTCPRCHQPRAGDQRFCPSCGLDYWQAAAGSAQPATPQPGGIPAAAPPRRDYKPALLLVLLLIIGAFWFMGQNRPSSGNGGGSNEDPDEPNARITGTFVRWEAVDDARGYAYFSITNHGPEDGVAECTIRVRNDFGNFGFDILSGEPIEAGETISGRIPIDVSEGSFLIDEGSVENC
jgi:hypothetical protein